VVQMALGWLLRDSRVTSVLIGASSVSQLEDNVAALNNMKFTVSELQQIEIILSQGKSNAQLHQPKVELTEDTTPSRGDFIKNLAKKVGSQPIKR